MTDERTPSYPVQIVGRWYLDCDAYQWLCIYKAKETDARATLEDQLRLGKKTFHKDLLDVVNYIIRNDPKNAEIETVQQIADAQMALYESIEARMVGLFSNE